MMGQKTPPPEEAAKGSATPKPEVSEWVIETTHGRMLQAPDVGTLHRWIIERRVTRDDRISKDGHSWQRVGDVAEFMPFFDIVDSAERARKADTPNPVLLPGPPAMAATPVAPGSSVWIDRGAFPQVEEHTETKIVAVRSNHLPLLLKLGLTTLVAGTVAFAGIALHNYRSSAGTVTPIVVTPVPDPVLAPPAAPAPGPTVEPEPDTPVIEEPEPEDNAAPPPPPHRRSRAASRAAARASRLAAARQRAAAPATSSAAKAPAPQAAAAAQGYAALNRRQFQEAIVHFKQALAGNPSNGTALFGLAEAYRETGQKAAALKAYRHYVQILPSGPDAGSARLQIRLLEGKR
jgi:hypothetical protein